MHLPFTFATGEAMLYQTGYPLHSFSESIPGKAKGSRAKKAKESPSDNLHPKSLLGALMSQDESVYVRQPDSEPAMSCYSSQQQTASECNSFLRNSSPHVASNERMSYDPLLATLDSLTLDGDDPCSNTELFNALESLGLNAEDLELLLLDERMIQVELDPNRIPTLSDLLTNNEILSYAHNALENSPEEVGRCGANTDLAAVSASAPIVQLSQQMQQHIGSGELLKASPAAMEIKGAAGLPNGHVQQSHPVLTPTPLNSELTHLLGWSQDQQLVQDVSRQQVIQDPLLLGFHDQMTINGSNGPFLPSVEVGHECSSTAPDVCHYQSYQQQLSLAQSSTLELEQLLGLSQSQHSLPAYNMFSSSAQAPAHNKVGLIRTEPFMEPLITVSEETQEKAEQLMAEDLSSFSPLCSELLALGAGALI